VATQGSNRVRLTKDPNQVVEVGDAELTDLARMGLIHAGSNRATREKLAGIRGYTPREADEPKPEPDQEDADADPSATDSDAATADAGQTPDTGDDTKGA
jgi:hypothetical protein